MKQPKAFLAALLAATVGAGAAIPAHAFEEGKLTVWIGDNKGPEGIRQIAKQFTDDTGVPVKIVNPDNLTDRFPQAAGSGQGPDIVIWAHDRLGEWAQSGLLKAVSPSKEYRDRFFNFTWQATRWNGKNYGYPISVESIGLIYNKAIVDTPPDSFQGLIELDAKLEKQGKKAILFDYGEPYFGWPLLAANGGYPFKKTADGYDVSDVGVDNAGAIEGAKLLQKLVSSGVVPEGTDANVMQTRFNHGEVATMITGPWAWSNLKKSGIDFGVAKLPKVGDKRAKPMVGVTAAMINSGSPNGLLATEFLENYLLSEKGIRTFNSDGSLGAVADKAYEKELESDPKIKGTMANARIGEPMPNVPQMGAFWSAMKPALQNIGSGRQKPEAALDAAQKRIEQSIK